MDTFDKEFIMQLFLDSDSVSSTNRIVAASADVVKEINDNIITFKETFNEEYVRLIPKAIDESEKLNGLNSREKNGIYENVILRYSDREFENTFKMKRSTCQELINLLKEFTKSSSMVVPLEKKIYVFLWLLTSGASFHEVGSLFALHKSTVSYIFYEMADLILEQRYQYITWPSIEEQHITRLKINSSFKFPNCVGFIDGCRLKVGSKRNKNGKPDTVILQAVCDESLMFTNIFVGDKGRTKKYKVYKDSPLSQELENFIEFENHILGDSEYKLRMNLITPFSSEELLTIEEMKFNEVHWKARSYIGRAFAHLKERFLKLNFLDINKSDAVCSVVCAACVLHNFIIIHEGNPEIKQETVLCDDSVVIDTTIVKNAVEKRQFLCNYINFIDSDSA